MKRIQEYLPEVPPTDGAHQDTRIQYDNCVLNCPVCGGIGYVRADVPLGDPRFGKIERCPNAAALDIQRMKADPRIGITERDFELSFENIRPVSPITQVVADIKPLVLSRASKTPKGAFVLIVGTPGIGKSLFLRTVVAVAVSSGITGAYANLSYTLDDLRRAYDTPNAGEELEGRFTWWQNLDILALDEFDKVNSTPWARERIHMLMDARYRLAVEGRGLTLVASNSEPMDDYLMSRFRDQRVGRVYRLNGQDIRTRTRELKLKW